MALAPGGQNGSYEITDLTMCRSLCETESRASPLAWPSGPAMLPRATSTAGSEVTGFFYLCKLFCLCFHVSPFHYEFYLLLILNMAFDLQNSTGNSVQYSVAAHLGGSLGGNGYMYMHG